MRRWWAAAIAGVLSFVVGCGDDPPVAPFPQSASGWTRVAGGATQERLLAVWISPSGRIYAGGAGVFVLTFDGAEWSVSRTPYYVQDIWGTTDRNIFAVAHNTIMHFDGVSWKHESNGPANGIWGDGVSDPFAVGGRGNILRRTDGKWLSMESPTTFALYDIWGTSESDVFAVGQYGRIVHFDGHQWSTVLSDVEGPLLAVGGRSAGDVIAAGDGVITHFDGVKWTRVDTGFTNTLWTAVKAVGEWVYVASDDGTLLRFEGRTWQQESGFPSGMWDVAVGRNEIVAVGELGQMVRRQGNQWISMFEDNRSYHVAAWAADDQHAIIGGNGINVGQAQHYEGIERGETFNFSHTVWDLWAESPASVYAVARTSAFHFNGSEWTDLGDPGIRDMYCVWGFGDQNIVVAGQDSVTAWYDGEDWSTRTTLNRATVRDLWGTDSSFLIGATQSEGILRFDGVAWHQWQPIQAAMVTGTSTSDIWLADWSGWIHHYDGLGWSKTLVAAGFWTRGVAAIRPDDVYVASTDGRIAHFDGAAWNIESSPAAPPLLAITASPSGNVIWAVGEAGAILRLDRGK